MLPVFFINFNSSYFLSAGYKIEIDKTNFLLADLLLSRKVRLPEARQVF